MRSRPECRVPRTALVPGRTADRDHEPIAAEHPATETRRWWQQRREGFDLYISQLVLDEAGAGDPTAVADRLRLLEGLPLLGESAEADRLADLLIARHLLPPKAAADAQHVALAATAGVDYLLAWNCKHIANADLLPALYETLRAEGFPSLLIVTPEEFSDAG